MLNLRPQLQNLLDSADQKQDPADQNEEKITVSSATKRIAFAYERFRNTLEPDEADILRRKAIARILKRRLEEGRPSPVIAEQLLQELIRANYIKNVTKKFARHIAAKLERTQQIRLHLSPAVAAWFLDIVSVSIDRELFPWRHEEMLVALMYKDTYARVEWTDNLVKEADRPTQLYMACHRALIEADDNEIAFHYFVHHFPEWSHPEFNTVSLNRLISGIPEFYAKIQTSLYHPARDRLTKILRPVAVPYRIIRDIIQREPQAFNSTDTLDQAVRETVSWRARKLRNRMSKRAWHSILFLFITKTVIALLVEVPYEVFLLLRFSWLALWVNIAFHPLLLFILTTTVRLPDTANTNRIVEEVSKIVTGEEIMSTLIISRTRTYGALTWSFFTLVYIVLFLGIFWGLFSMLALLEFSLIAMLIFVMFLGLVSFLAIRIRHSVNQIRIIAPREGAIGSIFTFISLPILEFGRWLAQKISQINIFLFFMDRVLEAPFKILIDVVEEWFTFVRDRREEIV
ncbi:MAG: hypothetical protein Q8P73_05115 [bacterium]|nr:hypothetical protein [bacterium]MDZ4347231.1 hypothetical protein [Candidatus Binatia bacterium]